MKVVISQSMLFPWVGLLEQVRLADVFVHYDDVQLSKSGFVRRVQLKTADGVRWLTVPTSGMHRGQTIEEVRLADGAEWIDEHLQLLRQAFAGAPHAADALSLAECVYRGGDLTLGALARRSLLALVDYFGIGQRTRFVDVRELGVTGSGSNRILHVVQRLGGTQYITGHGSANYLDHEAFESNDIRVEYMDYRKLPYPQLHGEFTPFVTSLDLVANCGRAGADRISSPAMPWQRFLAQAGTAGS